MRFSGIKKSSWKQNASKGQETSSKYNSLQAKHSQKLHLVHLIFAPFEAGSVKWQILRNKYIWIKMCLSQTNIFQFKSGKGTFWLCFLYSKSDNKGLQYFANPCRCWKKDIDWKSFRLGQAIHNCISCQLFLTVINKHDHGNIATHCFIWTFKFQKDLIIIQVNDVFPLTFSGLLVLKIAFIQHFSLI